MPARVSWVRISPPPPERILQAKAVRLAALGDYFVWDFWRKRNAFINNKGKRKFFIIYGLLVITILAVAYHYGRSWAGLLANTGCWPVGWTSITGLKKGTRIFFSPLCTWSAPSIADQLEKSAALPIRNLYLFSREITSLIRRRIFVLHMQGTPPLIDFFNCIPLFCFPQHLCGHSWLQTGGHTTMMIRLIFGGQRYRLVKGGYLSPVFVIW